MKQITSSENPAVKLIKKLEKKKFREETGLFVVEGLRACELAAETPQRIESFYLSESFAVNAADIVPFWEQFPCCLVTDKIFRSISGTETPQGILCVARLPEQNRLPEGARCLFLDNVRDPGNVGTIIRTADALGFDEVLLSENCADVYAPKTIRSTMGSIFSVKTMTNCPASALTEMKKRGYCIAASSLNEPCISLYRAEWGDKLVFVLGNEANGVCDEILALADFSVKIPMYGSAESFNVSIAAALLMGEAARRDYEE